MGHYLPVGDPFEQSHYLQPYPRYWALSILGSRPATLTFHGHVTPSVTCPLDSQVAIFYRHSLVSKSLSPVIFEIMGPKHIGVMTLTIQGHVTSLVTWPFDSQVAICCRRPVVTKSLSPAIFPIGAPLTSSLHPFPRYWTLSISGSVPWPFRVTCRHSTRDGSFPIDGPWDPGLYL